MSDEPDMRVAAKAFSKLGASKGGYARAQSLSSEERSEIARQAVMARWERKKNTTGAPDIPRATHYGELTIGDMRFPCSVLSDGTRILTQSDFMSGMGMYYSGWVAQNQAKKQSSADIPHFLAFKSLEPFIQKHLGDLQSITVRYRTQKGSLAHGIKAEIIPKICDVWIEADEQGKLGARQKQIARKAKVLMRALVDVAIIALIDEVTGYQLERDRDALHKILEAYIAKELLPWTKRFPDEFYQQMFRLQGWQYSPLSTKRPRLLAQLTIQTVYDKLPPGVLEVLRKKNPIIKDGRRRYKLFRFMTEDIGQPHLEKHLASVTTLMRISPNWKTFKKLLDKAFPTPHKLGEPVQQDMGFNEELDGEVIDIEHLVVDSEE
jgi:P63C domain-containing protein